MTKPDYNSPSSLKDFMESRAMAMQKKFGQNFMLNEKARNTIIDQLELKEGDCVWEIGPGLGCMTDILLQRGACVSVFEIDRGFIECLHDFFESYEREGKFKIIAGDCLKTWKTEFENLEKENPKKLPKYLMGNLPYNIAATFIADTITKGLNFEKCVFTVQKEVADRMAAKPGSENYSSFSVLCQWVYNVKSFLTLGPNNFWPKPNVASGAALMTKKEKSIPCEDPEFFIKLVHALFSSRRKTIHNNIKPLIPLKTDYDVWIYESGLSPQVRAEELTVEQLLTLSQNVLKGIMSQKGTINAAK